MEDIFCPCCGMLIDQTNIEQIRITKQNIVDAKDSFGMTVQRSPNKELPHIKRIAALKEKFHEAWKLLNPS